MKSERMGRMFLSAFLIAVVGYFLLYTLIERRRGRAGPWEVEFTRNPAGAPVLEVNQPTLRITNVRFVFDGQYFPATNRSLIVFSTPKVVPYDLPFGQCIFMDTTFLPGTITLQAFGHEIEFLPRVLTVDHERREWRSGEVIILVQTN